MGRPIVSVLFVLLLHVASFCNSLPLSTNSRWIVDQATGKRIKLTCVNWVSHLDPMIAEGLEKKPVSYIARQIAASGFNCVRFTWPTFMFTRPHYTNRTVIQSLDQLGLSVAQAGIANNNPQLLKMSVVDVHKTVVNELAKHKLMVVLDNHISHPGWCCSDNDGNGFFDDADFDPTEWLHGLTLVARTYKGNSAVVGMSMRNELRGSKQNEDDWYKYVQQGVDTIHKENPHLLIIVSGLSYDTNLGFLKTKPLQVNSNNKVVYEAHWYSFGTSSDLWAKKTNHLCAEANQRAKNNYLFLTRGNNSFPLFLSEFGMDQRESNVADDRYISCLLAAVAETDIDWALWTFQGSYILRQGTVNLEEVYGVMDINWNQPRNPKFLDRLQVIRQTNQVPKSNKLTSYIMFHPSSGKCVQIGMRGISLGSCNNAIWWSRGKSGQDGPIKLVGGQQCLTVAGDGAAVKISSDCSSDWKSISVSGLHLGAKNGEGRYFCLESAADFTIVTKKCLCVGTDLSDLDTCDDNPQVQWFKLVPVNV